MNIAINNKNQEFFSYLAGKYIWWQTPEDSLSNLNRIIVQVMNMGTYNDVIRLEKEVGRASFKEVLQTSGPGQLDERSWSYWHYRLRMAELDNLPPMPVRVFE